MAESADEFPPDGPDAWRALAEHHAAITPFDLRAAFADDSDRLERLTVDACGLHADLSKHLVTPTTVDLLVQLAEARDLHGRIEAMFTGRHINVTEDRAALHVALRMPRNASLVVDGVDVVA
ncbi:MAG: glucose-6-phosphate isomerase, partial [Acidobacteria bacterium]|nr:glucose-6-phosphate isomerase [Acidobacteriota bacterium]